MPIGILAVYRVCTSMWACGGFVYSGYVHTEVIGGRYLAPATTYFGVVSVIAF